MHLRLLVLLLLVSFAQASWSEQGGELSAADCQIYFSADDPALFKFVETRNQTSFADYAGMRIASIETVTLPVFNENDPKENYWPFRLANRLHIETRPDTIERQLIFATGEPLDQQKILENERLLRENNYLIDAMILPARVCGSDIHLLVVVRDVWTLSPSASASRTGGENRSDIGISESNLLGRGQRLSVGYFDNSERSGKTLDYRHPNIIGKYTELLLGIEDNSDGEANSIELVRPFFELDSTWAAGAAWSESSQIETIETHDEELNRYREETEYYELFYGWSRGRQNDVVQRWFAGVTSDVDSFQTVDADISEIPEDRAFRYPWLEWRSMEDRFVTLSNITHSHRHEDLLVGFSHRLRLGYASERLDSSHDAWIFEAESGYSASFGNHHLLRVTLSADGRYNIDEGYTENTFYSGLAEYYHFPDRKNRWYAKINYIAGRNINDDDELTVGGGYTLRGYPDEYQRGNRQWVMTVEQRHFTDFHFLQLAYLGAAVYVDAGRTWNSEEPSSVNDDPLANLGIGLRASPSKFNVDRVLHVDIAWPLVNRDEVDSYQLIVSGRVDF